jgi:hypothetical protein
MNDRSPPLAAERQQLVVTALAAVHSQECRGARMPQSRKASSSPDEPGQFGAAALAVGDEARRMLLYQAV